MQINNGSYKIQDIKILDLVNEFGAPLYVYDASKIVSQIAQLKNAFKGSKLQIKYAAKALTNPAILKLMKKNEVGLDVVSLQELQLGIQMGFHAEEIMYTPNCVSFEEIRAAVKAGAMTNIDNIPFLELFGKEYGGTMPMCIRINPHIMAGGNIKISTGHADSKFGISIAQLDQALNIVRQYRINVAGLHVHTGSDILDSEVFLQGAQIVFDTAKKLEDLNFIDFGSGFKVPYEKGDIVTDIDDLGQKLCAVFQNFCREYGKELEIWIEPGKFLVSEAGYFLVKVNVIKKTFKSVFAGVDSGMNHLIRPMMYHAYHEMINVSNPTGSKHTYNVVGYICETDNFGWGRKLHELRAGDVIAIKNAGAYGYSMTSNYNSRFRPSEVLIIDGKAKLIRRRDTMDDLLANVIPIDL